MNTHKVGWSSSKTHKAIARMRANLSVVEAHATEVARRAASPGPEIDGYSRGTDGAGVSGGGTSGAGSTVSG